MNAAKLRAAALVFFVGFALGISVFAASRLFVRSILTGDAVAAAEALAARLADGGVDGASGTLSAVGRYSLIGVDGTIVASGRGQAESAPRLSKAEIDDLVVLRGPAVALAPLTSSLLGLTEPVVDSVAVPVVRSDGTRIGTLYAEIDQRLAQTSLSRAFGIVGVTAMGLGILAFVAIAFALTRGRGIEPKKKPLDIGALPRDPLTHALTRQSFELVLAETVERAAAAESAIAVMAIELDGLRAANDTWGHRMGDELLRIAAERMAAFARTDGRLARISGDEFAFVVDGDVNSHSLRFLAREMTTALTAPYLIDGSTILLGARIGIGLYPVNAENAEMLFRAADVALRKAMGEGRQAVAFFDTAMQAGMQRRARLERDLRSALERDEFVVFYQPQLDLNTGRLRGYEALVRWERPEEGIVGPADFLSVAEETGLLRPLGEWVLRKACEDAATWLDSGTVAVNFSRSQFRSGDLDQTIAKALADTGLPPERLEIEVPESLFLEHAPDVMDMLRRIKALGVRVAMDDFGTGYSGLGALAAFPIDKIKIDRSFVAQLVDDPQVAAIVASIIGLGRSLSFDITAEGVESSEQVTMLKAAGCSIAQGFLFGVPQRQASPESASGPAADAGQTADSRS